MPCWPDTKIFGWYKQILPKGMYWRVQKATSSGEFCLCSLRVVPKSFRIGGLSWSSTSLETIWGNWCVCVCVFVCDQVSPLAQVPRIDPRRCEVREQRVRTWLYHPMCSFLFDLKVLRKPISLGPDKRPSFSGLLMLDLHRLTCTSWSKHMFFNPTNRTPLHMSWDSFLIILLNYHSNFSVVSFFIYFHLCKVFVFGTRGCWIIGGFISFFPGEGFSTQAKTNIGIWYDIIIYIVRLVSWVNTWIHMNRLRRIGSTSYIRVWALQFLCNHILFGVKSIFKSTNVHLKELTYSNRTQKISICLVHIWFMALSSTFSIVNCDLWWCTLVHGAMVTCDHKNIEMLSCYLRHAA